MKTVAVLHSAFAVLVLAGLFALSGVLQLAAFGLGGVLFVAGIVVARQDD